MTDWVNWSQYAEQVTPEVQRMAQERQQSAANQQAAMTQGVESLRQQSRAQGGASDITKLGGYGQLMGQQQQAYRQQAQQQAMVSPWEAQLGGAQQAENPWSQLSSRLQDVQQESNRMQAKKSADIAEQQRKTAEDAALKQTAKVTEQGRRQQLADTDRARLFRDWAAQKVGGQFAQFNPLNPALPFDPMGAARQTMLGSILDGYRKDGYNSLERGDQARIQAVMSAYLASASPEERADFEQYMGGTQKGGK